MAKIRYWGAPHSAQGTALANMFTNDLKNNRWVVETYKMAAVKNNPNNCFFSECCLLTAHLFL